MERGSVQAAGRSSFCRRWPKRTASRSLGLGTILPEDFEVGELRGTCLRPVPDCLVVPVVPVVTEREVVVHPVLHGEDDPLSRELVVVLSAKIPALHEPVGKFPGRLLVEEGPPSGRCLDQGFEPSRDQCSCRFWAMKAAWV